LSERERSTYRTRRSGAGRADRPERRHRPLRPGPRRALRQPCRTPHPGRDVRFAAIDRSAWPHPANAAAPGAWGGAATRTPARAGAARQGSGPRTRMDAASVPWLHAKGRAWRHTRRGRRTGARRRRSCPAGRLRPARITRADRHADAVRTRFVTAGCGCGDRRLDLARGADSRGGGAQAAAAVARLAARPRVIGW